MSEKQDQYVQTAVKLRQSSLDRADKLAERMTQPGLDLTRTDLIRMALHRGFDVLEAELKAKR